MKYKGLLPVILITGFFLFFYYSLQIINADKLSYASWGDGYKNYYTLAYYLQNDKGAHFTGMNYPYGENVLFTDNQPIVAWILKCVSKVFPALPYHIHGFLAWIIFFSIILAAVLIYLTLTEMQMAILPAVCFSVLIAMLSPQLMRLDGLFSLAYSFFLPLIIYLSIKYFKTKGGFKYFVYLTITITFFAFVHIYYLAMAGMFVILIALIHFATHINKAKENLRFTSLLALTGFIPFFFLKSFIYFTDPITDRPSAPWGFITYRSTVFDILLNKNSFTGEAIAGLFPHANIVYHNEGYGYIGLITLFSVAGLFAVFIRKLFDKKNFLTEFYPFNYFFPAAVIVLLFAMAFPFCIDSVEKYYDILPTIIKQFRAPGRFNWVFYYTATILASLFLWRMFGVLKKRKKWVAYLFLITAVFIWFIDMNMVSIRARKQLKNDSLEVNEATQSSNLIGALSKIGKSPNSFQAIFPLPFFLNGSEKLYIESGMNFDAMKTSLLTGLPIACGQMSRTSEHETFHLINLIANDYLRKDILHLYKNDKPLLMICDDGDLNPQEKQLFLRANYLFRVNGMNYYELPLRAFADLQDKVKRSFIERKKNYYRYGNYLSTDTLPSIIIESFDSLQLPYVSFGKGARYSENEDVMFYFDTLPNAIGGAHYEVSLWFYSDSRIPAFPVLYGSQVDSNGRDIESYEVNGKFSTNTFGKWVMQKFDFTLRNRKNKLYLSGAGQFATYDEVMVRPLGVEAITQYQNDSTFSFNNYPIR